MNCFNKRRLLMKCSMIPVLMLQLNCCIFKVLHELKECREPYCDPWLVAAKIPIERIAQTAFLQAAYVNTAAYKVELF